jgi:hypothetical protein
MSVIAAIRILIELSANSCGLGYCSERKCIYEFGNVEFGLGGMRAGHALATNYSVAAFANHLQ